jgi:hypothetical protein
MRFAFGFGHSYFRQLVCLRPPQDGPARVLDWIEPPFRERDFLDGQQFLNPEFAFYLLNLRKGQAFIMDRNILNYFVEELWLVDLHMLPQLLAKHGPQLINLDFFQTVPVVVQTDGQTAFRKGLVITKNLKFIKGG